MFLAAIEVREAFEYWGHDEKELAGTWTRMCQDARGFPGSTVMSHELLCAATPEQASRALQELEGLDVHLVYTARDLGRQLLSEWQERVKNGSSQSFDAFQRTVVKRLRQGNPGLFWRNHGLVDALDRWGAGLPASKIHVVVAPPPGSEPEELWRRFGDAVGFDAAAIDPTGGRESANQTLGVVQVAALRRVNRALGERIRHPEYGRIVKRQFSQGVLGRQEGRRPYCPADLVAELRGVAEETNATIAARGYQVHGRLDELLPVPPPEGAPAPDDVDSAEEAQLLAAVVADILVERSKRSGRKAAATPSIEALAAPVPAGFRALLGRARSVAAGRSARR